MASREPEKHLFQALILFMQNIFDPIPLGNLLWLPDFA